MPAPILATKLYLPPPRSGIVPRLRLVERLNEGLAAGRKLTLLSAPAGFGKTSLVSEWISTFIPVPSSVGGGMKVAWFSLDEGDHDPARFISYLVAALKTIQAGIGEGLLVALQSPQPPSIESLLTNLLNEIAAISGNPSTGSGQRFILVLDDYHVVDSKPVDQVLTFLVEHQPPQMHLVIATREDPPLPLARLRVRGQLTELRATDLRFTPAETAEFLNRVMGLNLSEEDIAALDKRTEGWIAGLQLAALSMQGREDTASFIQSFAGSHRFVLDYLGEEVLQHQHEDIRSFLLQTALLDRFCAPLCNAVTEREAGKEVLDILERSNLFLIPLDDQRQWYRYHHLFAEVLQAHLMETQPDRVPTLHQRASAWYERNGLPSDAIRHALAAKDFERAAGLLELAWPATEEGNLQPTTWLGWVKRLPDELVRARPVLTTWYAYALLGRGELEAANARLQEAERWLDPADYSKVQLETPLVETYPESFDHAQDKLRQRMVVVDQEQFKSLPATIAVGRAYIAQALGNLPDTVRYASRVLELAEADPFRHSQASMLLGMTHWASGDLEAADRVFAKYTMKLRAAGNIPDAISTSIVLADIRLALGHLHEAISTLERLLQFIMDQDEPIPLDIADLHRELGELYLEQGNLEAATQYLRRSKELGEKAELPVWQYRWCTAQAKLKETQADLNGAFAFLDEAERLYIRTPLPDFCPISALKARIWVAQGSLTKALGWVREQSLSVDDAPSFLREFGHMTLARVLIAQYKSDRGTGSIRQVIGLLERLLQAAEDGKRVGSVIEILALLALAHQAQGNITTALVSLERALTLAEPEGYVRIFLGEGKPMVELLGRLDESRTARLKTYVHKLLAAFGTEEIHASPFIRQPLIEPLSEHELEVLRLLRTELNGPEIARKRMVSLSTIRTHTQHIYAKLGVNNRRAAVHRAEELNLL